MRVQPINVEAGGLSKFGNMCLTYLTYLQESTNGIAVRKTLLDGLIILTASNKVPK